MAPDADRPRQYQTSAADRAPTHTASRERLRSSGVRFGVLFDFDIARFHCEKFEMFVFPFSHGLCNGQYRTITSVLTGY